MLQKKANKDYSFKASNDEYYVSNTHHQGWGQLQGQTTFFRRFSTINGNVTNRLPMSLIYDFKNRVETNFGVVESLSCNENMAYFIDSNYKYISQWIIDFKNRVLNDNGTYTLICINKYNDYYE